MAILVRSRDHRTQIWKGAIQGPFHQSLVQIGPVASEELIKIRKVNRRTTDAQSGELKKTIGPGAPLGLNQADINTISFVTYTCSLLD